MNRVTSPGEAGAITDFFVDNFWDAPIAKPKQRQQLSLEVYKDLTGRYMASKAVRVLYIECMCGWDRRRN